MTETSFSQQYAGQIDFLGDASVFGAGMHPHGQYQSDLVYLNMVGSKTTVEGVWAQLARGRSVPFHPLSDKTEALASTALFLENRSRGKETPLVRFDRHLTGLNLRHLILLDRRMVQPDYDQAGWTYAFDLPGLARSVGAHVRAAIDITFFPQWEEPLLALARQEKGLITSILSWGPSKMLAIRLDKERWQQAIALGLERGDLTWPD